MSTIVFAVVIVVAVLWIASIFFGSMKTVSIIALIAALIAIGLQVYGLNDFFSWMDQDKIGISSFMIVSASLKAATWVAFAYFFYEICKHS